MREVAAAAAVWRQEAPGPGKNRARDQLAEAILALVGRVVGTRVAPTYRADLVQEIGAKMVVLVERGEAHEGSEDAFVAACTRNLIRDFFRRHPAGRLQPLDEEEAQLPADAPDPEQALIDRQREQHRRARLERIKAVLPRLHADHRRALMAVHIEGRSIDDLVQELLRRRILAGEIPDPPGELDLRKARATVDQWLSRARARVRAELCAETAREEQ